MIGKVPDIPRGPNYGGPSYQKFSEEKKIVGENFSLKSKPQAIDYGP